jgi:hypothetical protein
VFNRNRSCHSEGQFKTSPSFSIGGDLPFDWIKERLGGGGQWEITPAIDGQSFSIYHRVYSCNLQEILNHITFLFSLAGKEFPAFQIGDGQYNKSIQKGTGGWKMKRDAASLNEEFDSFCRTRGADLAGTADLIPVRDLSSQGPSMLGRPPGPYPWNPAQRLDCGLSPPDEPRRHSLYWHHVYDVVTQSLDFWLTTLPLVDQPGFRHSRSPVHPTTSTSS